MKEENEAEELSVQSIIDENTNLMNEIKNIKWRNAMLEKDTR